MGDYQFNERRGSTIDYLIVETAFIMGDAHHSSDVVLIAVAAPKDHPWTRSQAKTDCEDFLPSDAHFIKSVFPIVDFEPEGEDDIYHSASLMQAFPASDFLGPNHSLATPGVFDVLYYEADYGNAGQYLSCIIDLGDVESQSF